MKAWNILYWWKRQKLWRAILTQYWAFTTVTLQFLWGLYLLNWQPVQPYINKRTLDPNSFFFRVKIFCKQTLSTIFSVFAWKYWNMIRAHFHFVIHNFLSPENLVVFLMDYVSAVSKIIFYFFNKRNPSRYCWKQHPWTSIII